MTRFTALKKPILAIVLLLPAASVVGCSTYTAKLTVRPEKAAPIAPSGFFDEEKTKIAQEITRKLAEEHGMNEVPGPYDPRFTRPYRVLNMFLEAGLNRDVALSAAVKDDGSELVFVVTDQAHGAETKFTAALMRKLKEQVQQKLPGYPAVFESISTPRNPLAP